MNPTVLLTASILFIRTHQLFINVFLKNDDGPPGPESPYVYGLYRYLTRDLGEQDQPL